jgi:phospholipid/cholesterol/gamma-HCH transport system ATP-binding protein
MADSAFLQLTDVYKRFGDKPVFEGLGLSIARGEALTIVGSSGSGKSVLLKLLMGLCKADSGSVCFDGVDLGPLSEDDLGPFRARMSMLFQGGALFDSLTVGENIAYPLRVPGIMGEAEIGARVRDRLDLVGLAGTEEVMPAALSGGMKKRVALARAIAGDPEVILYDEPTTGLDPITARRISDLIRGVQRQLHVTSVVVTHDLGCAFVVSDRVAMIAERRIGVVLPTDAFRRSEIPAVHQFICAMPMSERDDKEAGNPR